MIAETYMSDTLAELALSLIESLDGPAAPDVEDAWRREIERRVAQSSEEKST